MKITLLLSLIFLLFTLLSSCGTGYTRENGQWTWVTNDENYGRRPHWIEAP